MKQPIAFINMIKQQMRSGGVVSENILELYQNIPRTDFVPETYKDFAYSDLQIQLPNNQRMMTPLEEALLLQSLNLQGNEIVLEIGTGTGFLTALLSRLSKKVISIEYFSDLADRAHQNLSVYNFNNIELACGDGSQILTDDAPYDVIIFTSPTTKVDEKIYAQVAPHGKMFTIIGSAPISRAYINQLDNTGTWNSKLVFETTLPELLTTKAHTSFVF
jgi:protein-L-isoaspartate(D-aspartate) O-methyltransferase